MKKRFNIDFIEFAFLVEACIPPVPIARACFWSDVINIHYFKLNQDERFNLFNWINRTSKMEASLSENNESCLLFNARLDPDNQYEVTTKFNEVIECFKLNDKYYISEQKHINEKYIVNVEKL